MRRSICAIATVQILLLGVAGCGSVTSAGTAFVAPEASMKNVTVGSLEVTYPGGWHVRTHGLITNSGNGSQLVAFSNQPMRDGCPHRSHATGGVAGRCHDVISRLDRDSFLAVWSLTSMPARDLQAGAPIDLGGVTGRWRVLSDPHAQSLGSTQAISFVVPDPGSPHSSYALRVLVRGPHDATLVDRIRGMAMTVRWPKDSVMASILIKTVGGPSGSASRTVPGKAVLTSRLGGYTYWISAAPNHYPLVLGTYRAYAVTRAYDDGHTHCNLSAPMNVTEHHRDFTFLCQEK